MPKHVNRYNSIQWDIMHSPPNLTFSSTTFAKNLLQSKHFLLHYGIIISLISSSVNVLTVLVLAALPFSSFGSYYLPQQCYDWDRFLKALCLTMTTTIEILDRMVNNRLNWCLEFKKKIIQREKFLGFKIVHLWRSSSS